MNTIQPTSCLLVSPVTTDASISMQLYSRNVEHVLRQKGYRVAVLRAKNIRRPRLLSKVSEVLLRYVYYPLYILGSSASLVHVTDHTYAYLIPVIHFSGKKSIVSVHNRPQDILSDKTWERHETEALIPAASRFLFRLSMRAIPQADRIICIAPSIYTSLIGLGIPKHKLHVIPPPISDLFFKPLGRPEQRYIREQLRKKNNEFFIVHPGNNDPAHKNIEHILRCVSLLRRNDVPVRFIKAGDQFSDSQKAFIRQHQLSGSVTHVGVVSQEALRLIYHYSDVLLFPSYYEGCPAPPWEALACSLPVVVSDIPVHKDYFARYAFFVPVDDYKKTARLIRTIIKHPQITRQKTLAGRRAAERIRPHAVADKFYSLYAGILS